MYLNSIGAKNSAQVSKKKQKLRKATYNFIIFLQVNQIQRCQKRQNKENQKF